MLSLPLIVLFLAAVCFLVGAFSGSSRVNLIAFGLFLCVLYVLMTVRL